MEALQQLQARVGHPLQYSAPQALTAQQPQPTSTAGSKKCGPLHVRMGSGSIASNDSNLVSLIGGIYSPHVFLAQNTPVLECQLSKCANELCLFTQLYDCSLLIVELTNSFVTYLILE